ncbi:MAG: bacteriocin [Candidatus Kapaibacterium sp.]|nr:MAG: bacteriocin [Candidatus Kapabacteria bacterium]
MKELNFEQMAQVEGGGCGMNIVACAMIGGCFGPIMGVAGGVIGALSCL